MFQTKIKKQKKGGKKVVGGARGMRPRIGGGE